jgi:hypothetical protein
VAVAAKELLRRADLAEQLLDRHGTADAQDVRLVRNALVRVPAEHLERLLDQGTRIAVVRGGITEYFPELVGLQPPGWSEGSTYADVPGVYHPAHDVVVIAVQGHEDGERFLSREGLTVYHEVGHALDPFNHGGEGSSSEAFREAHAEEFEDLAPYFQQEGDRGAVEAYAETYARQLVGDDAWFGELDALEDYWEGDPLAELARREELAREVGEAVVKGLEREIAKRTGERIAAIVERAVAALRLWERGAEDLRGGLPMPLVLSSPASRHAQRTGAAARGAGVESGTPSRRARRGLVGQLEGE